MLCFVTTRVWILEARSENDCGNDIFFVLKLGQDLENRGHTTTKKSQELPLPPPPQQAICIIFIPGRLIILRVSSKTKKVTLY